jgi:hypothetical protein
MRLNGRADSRRGADEKPVDGHQRELGHQIQTTEDVDRSHEFSAV